MTSLEQIGISELSLLRELTQLYKLQQTLGDPTSKFAHMRGTPHFAFRSRQLQENINNLEELLKDHPQEVPTEAWVIAWKRGSGPMLSKCFSSGIGVVALYLTKKEAEYQRDIEDMKDIYVHSQGNKVGIREVRKVYVEFLGDRATRTTDDTSAAE